MPHRRQRMSLGRAVRPSRPALSSPAAAASSPPQASIRCRTC